MLKNNQSGLTIVEILVVLAIFGLILSMSFFSYKSWQRQILVNNTKDEIKSVLIRAQQSATAAASNRAWGVHFETSTYTLFPGDFYNQSDPDNKIWSLHGVEIFESYNAVSDGAGGYGPDVVFDKFHGTTYNTGTVNIIISGNPSFSKDVTIQSSGQID